MDQIIQKIKFLFNGGKMDIGTVAKEVMNLSNKNGLEWSSMEKAMEFIKGIVGSDKSTVNLKEYSGIKNKILEAIKGKMSGGGGAVAASS